MNSTDSSWLLLLEAALPFFILSLVLILTIMAGRKKFKQAAKMLILSVKSSEDREKQKIISFLTEKLAIEEKQAKKKAKKIINEKKFLIRNMVSGLLDKNVDAIAQLNQDLIRVTDRYHQLEVKIPDVEIVEEPEETEQEIDLKGEIKSLKQEVHITLTTLNNIFKEFSSMFGEDDIPEGQMTVDQIITAMESFSGKTVESAGDESISEESISDQQAPEDDGSLESQLQDSLSNGDEVNSDAGDSDSESKLNPKESEKLDFSIDSAIDDIDSALDGLELDASEDGADEEPDWGDAFAESGDKMEGDSE